MAAGSQKNSKNANKMHSDASGCRQIVAKSKGAVLLGIL